MVVLDLEPPAKSDHHGLAFDKLHWVVAVRVKGKEEGGGGSGRGEERGWRLLLRWRGREREDIVLEGREERQWR